MNMKWLGRNIEEFYCKKHLMEKLGNLHNKEFTKDDWNKSVKRFKDQGCSLF